jgi:hypothetical protein
MSQSDASALKRAIQSEWSGQSSAKAKRYVGVFFNAT